jgi:hypothetical protein
MIIFYPAGVIVINLLVWPFEIILFTKYSRVLYLRSKGIKKMEIPTFSLLIGLLLIIFGFFLSTDYLITHFGERMRLYADLIQLFAIILCALSFYFLPSFAEYDWLEKIRAVYIIHPSGISLFNHNFRPFENLYESDLTTGAIIALKSLIEEMSEKGKNLESIQKEGFTILLEYGTNIISALLVDDDSISLREKNKIFCREFQKMFPNLGKWYGNVDEFVKAEKLIKEIFFII